MMNFTFKSLALTSFLLLGAGQAFAQVTTETIDGLRYKISAGGKKATLIANEDEKYAGNIVVPESVTAKDGNTYPVVAFGEECFIGCDELQSVHIPNSVTKLGDRCFMNCPGLTEVNIPTSITALPVGCFGFCSSLTSIEVPSSVTSLGGACFMDCSQLTNVSLPSTIDYLPEQCFSRCVSLKSLEIPSSVTSIADYCFYRCYTLEAIKIPYSVTAVGAHCFEMCVALANVEVSSTVNLLYDECFSYCAGLQNIYFNGQVPDNTLNCGARTEATLHVPEQYLQRYIDEVGERYKNIVTWIPNELNRVEQVGYAGRRLLATSQAGVVTLSGLSEGEQVQLFSLDGKLLATLTAVNGAASCPVSASVVVAHVKDASVKIVVR